MEILTPEILKNERVQQEREFFEQTIEKLYTRFRTFNAVKKTECTVDVGYCNGYSLEQLGEYLEANGFDVEIEDRFMTVYWA